MIFSSHVTSLVSFDSKDVSNHYIPGGDKRHKLDIKIPKTSYTSLLSAVLVGLQQFYRIKLLWRTTCSALLVVSMEMIRTAALLLCLCGNACLAQDFR